MCDACNFPGVTFKRLNAEMTITFVQISIELFETSKVLASEPKLFQSDGLELI